MTNTARRLEPLSDDADRPPGADCLAAGDFALLFDRAVLREDRLRIETHLRRCAACARRVERWALTNGMEDRLRDLRSSNGGATTDASPAPARRTNDMTQSVPPPSGDDSPAWRETPPASSRSALVLSSTAPTAPDPPPDPGNELPRIRGYRLHSEIGRGGMGVVYSATQEALRRRVAVKVLPTRGSLAEEMFIRESELAAKLQHANIVQVYDSGKTGNALYYVMEFVDGPSASALVKELARFNAHKLPAAKVLKLAGLDPATAPPELRSPRPGAAAYHRQLAWWIAGVADGLQRAHEEKIWHRDVKPGNLLLARDGRMMITDFGLAKDGGKAEDDVTGGAPKGTWAYASPEQVAGLSVDGRSDVYSLGATLYELLTYRRAYSGDTVHHIRTSVIARSPEPPRTVLKAVPLALERICVKAMSRDSADRYQTAAALADDLRAWLTGATPEPAAGWKRTLATTLVTFSFAAALVALCYFVPKGKLSRVPLLAQLAGWLQPDLREPVPKPAPLPTPAPGNSNTSGNETNQNGAAGEDIRRQGGNSNGGSGGGQSNTKAPSKPHGPPKVITPRHAGPALVALVFDECLDCSSSKPAPGGKACDKFTELLKRKTEGRAELVYGPGSMGGWVLAHVAQQAQGKADYVVCGEVRVTSTRNAGKVVAPGVDWQIKTRSQGEASSGDQPVVRESRSAESEGHREPVRDRFSGVEYEVELRMAIIRVSDGRPVETFVASERVRTQPGSDDIDDTVRRMTGELFDGVVSRLESDWNQTAP